ncbi:SDR family NAD(P)-dependent oxidoreductase [Bradyrhizobium glycinis]|uniref:SDR family NAD(P)-dependent oxidoreductase n=1 Tax=Bradyrhizobium glycinis TaxID=2751812 RepID=UPI0018D5D82B|nr:SDR family NAD(P)-dependent oxidoreductase [Bradyrhizobium glycinis]MBH5371600.1 SDR family NAD(P)-dependent oxidoreductase [Bradyrhizobium glycinis]
MEFAGKTAVITGGGAGIGRELVHQLVAEGCNVAICDVFPDGMAETKRLSQLERPHEAVCITTHLADVSVEDQLKRFRQEVAEQHDTDKIHLLFNNAGVSGGRSLFTSAREDWERTFDICWGGLYLGVRIFLPLLMNAEEGHIINTSIVAGFWGTSAGRNASQPAYVTAKHAVKGFTEALINDLRLNAPHIKCSVVMPGYIGTEMIVRNSRKVHGGADRLMDDVVARLRMAGVQIDNMSPDVLRRFSGERARKFIDDAPNTAEQAVKMILEGVRAGKWRIFAGADAQKIDGHIRRGPENAYAAEVYKKVAEDVGWFAW